MKIFLTVILVVGIAVCFCVNVFPFDDGDWQYRNKLSVKPPISFTKYKIQPYLADETFFDSDSKELNRNRLYSGVSFNIFKQLKGEFYYLWQRSKSSSSGKWSDYDVLGTKLKIAF